MKLTCCPEGIGSRSRSFAELGKARPRLLHFWKAIPGAKKSILDLLVSRFVSPEGRVSNDAVVERAILDPELEATTI
jgi:hypothetical protein